MPKILKGGVLLTAFDGDELNQHTTRSRNSKGGPKSPAKFLGHINSKCRTCTKTIDQENSLTCDKCEGWVHFKCSKLTKHEYEFLCTTTKTKLKYFCQACEASASDDTGKGAIQIQDAKIDDLSKRFESVELQNKAIMDMLRKDDKKEEKKEQVLKVTVEEAFEDSKEKQEKKNNLILFNLPESESKEEKVSQEEDLAKVRQILKYVNGGSSVQDLEDNQISRMGERKDSSPRPRGIKIIFSNFHNKMKILKNAIMLGKKEEYKKFGLSPDKTWNERQADIELRKELEIRKAAGEDVIIYRGNVILRKDRPINNRPAAPAEAKASDTSEAEGSPGNSGQA